MENQQRSFMHRSFTFFITTGMQQTGAPAPVAVPLQDLCSSPNFSEDGLGTVCIGFACRIVNLLGE